MTRLELTNLLNATADSFGKLDKILKSVDYDYLHIDDDGQPHIVFEDGVSVIYLFDSNGWLICSD